MKKKKERREEGEEEERRKKRLRPVVVPWRAIYRTPDFFSSFFIPSPRASRDYLVSFSPFLSLSLFFSHFFLSISFAFHLRRKSPRACSSSSFLLFVLFPHRLRPPNVQSPPSPHRLLSSSPPASHACTRPFFCRIFPRSSFRCRTLRGVGAVRRDAHADGGKEGGRKKERERRRAERSGITASAKSCG